MKNYKIILIAVVVVVMLVVVVMVMLVVAVVVVVDIMLVFAVVLVVDIMLVFLVVVEANVVVSDELFSVDGNVERIDAAVSLSNNCASFFIAIVSWLVGALLMVDSLSGSLVGRISSESL
jgi:hypothetical protein